MTENKYATISETENKYVTVSQTEKLYKTDLPDGEWKIIEPLIPPAKQGDRPRKINTRLVVNGIFYRTGCSWEMLPKEYEKCKTIYGYFNEWSKDGTWKAIDDELVAKIRLKDGREQPILAIILTAVI